MDKQDKQQDTPKEEDKNIPTQPTIQSAIEAFSIAGVEIQGIAKTNVENLSHVETLSRCITAMLQNITRLHGEECDIPDCPVGKDLNLLSKIKALGDEAAIYNTEAALMLYLLVGDIYLTQNNWLFFRSAMAGLGVTIQQAIDANFTKEG